jgi:hypothetical protein
MEFWRVYYELSKVVVYEEVLPYQYTDKPLQIWVTTEEITTVGYSSRMQAADVADLVALLQSVPAYLPLLKIGKMSFENEPDCVTSRYTKRVLELERDT